MINDLLEKYYGFAAGLTGISALERIHAFWNTNGLGLQAKLAENPDLYQTGIDFVQSSVFCLIPGLILGGIAGQCAAKAIHYATRQEKKE